MQVSDRVISRPVSAGTYVPIDQQFNKALVWGGELVFAFTGIAHIDGMPTSEWVAHFQARDAPGGLYELADALASAFQSPKLKYSPLAIIGCGFGRIQGIVQPYRVIVSNCIRDGHWNSRVAEAFQVELGIKSSDDPVHVLCMPEWLSTQDTADLRRQLRSAIRHDKLVAAAEMCCRAIWKVAARTRAVGRDVLVVSFPKVYEDLPNGQYMLLNGIPSASAPRFLYVTPYGASDIQYMPISTGPSGVITGGEIRRL